MATKMSLKILVDKNKNKVLFAEARKDIVDFLFSLLSLLVATIVKLLTAPQTTTGCIGNLYCSVDNLDKIYMQPNVDNCSLRLVLPAMKCKCCLCRVDCTDDNMPFPQSDFEDSDKSQSNERMKTSYYGCIQRTRSTCGSCVTNATGVSCPYCRREMTSELRFIEGQGSTVASGSGCAVGGGGGGYVKEVVTYMITDNLEVKPMSTISSIAILNRYEVEDVRALEDRVVHLGTKEGLDLLRVSLQSKSVLTDVFLKKGIKVESCT